MAGDAKSRRVVDAAEELDRAFRLEPLPEPADEQDVMEQAVQDARARGYREGREQAETELRREIDNFRSVVSDSVRRLADLESSVAKRLEAQLIELAVDAASRIVRQRLDDGDAVAVRALQEAMESLPAGEGIRVRLHPDDLEGVAAELKTEVESDKVVLVGDPELTRGGCVVESAAGTIDATIEAAEAAVRVAVLGREESA